MSLELEKSLASLENLSEDVRAAAVTTLGQLRDPAAFLALARMTTGDASIQLRFTAKKVLRNLREAVRTEEPHLELTDDAGVLQQHLYNADPAVRRKILDLCLAFRKVTIVPLIPKLLETETDPAVKRSALLVASLAGRHAIRVVAPFTVDTDESVRAAAIVSLGVIDDVDIFPHAVRALSDSTPAVYRGAFRICSRLGKTNFHRLLDRMAASSTAWKRLAAVQACARIKQAHLGPIIQKLVGDPDPAVKDAARAAMASLGQPGAVAPPAPPSATAAPPSSPQAAGHVAAPVSPQTTAAAPASPPAEVDAGVPPEFPPDELEAWVRESDTSRVPDIREWYAGEKDPKRKASLVAAAGKLGGRLAVEMLKDCLSDEDGRIRANAVEGLRGKVRPEVLLGLVTDSDNRCRANAIVALKDYRRLDVLKHLKEMAAGDAPSRKSAIYAIVEIGSPEAADILTYFDDDPDEDVREKAKEAREIIESRLAESQEALDGEGNAAESSAGATSGGASSEGSNALEQLKARIAEAFGAFKKRFEK